jgi:hypothetical protein
MGFRNGNRLYQTVLQTYEKIKGSLHCVSQACCRQHIKLECVTNAMYRTRNDRISGVSVMQLPFNLPPSIGNFWERT